MPISTLKHFTPKHPQNDFTQTPTLTPTVTHKHTHVTTPTHLSTPFTPTHTQMVSSPLGVSPCPCWPWTRCTVWPTAEGPYRTCSRWGCWPHPLNKAQKQYNAGQARQYMHSMTHAATHTVWVNKQDKFDKFMFVCIHLQFFCILHPDTTRDNNTG